MPAFGVKLKSVIAALGLLVLQLVLGCRQPTAVALQPELEILASFSGGEPWSITSSPEGAIFLATSGGLFRAAPGDDRRWVQLAPGPVPAQDLYAPSGDVLFVVVGDGSVYRWTQPSGLRRMQTPLSDSVIVGSDFIRYGVPLWGLWGRSERDVYAVGMDGAIVHFDGTAWTLEANPLIPVVDSDVTSTYGGSWLSGVSGTRDAVYTAGRDLLIKPDGRQWASVPFPAGDFATYCGRQAVVVQGDAVLIGGGEAPCLIRRTRDGRWQVLSRELRIQGFPERGIGGGATQADGSALFWSTAYGLGAVAEVRGPVLRVYTFPSLKWFGGGTTVGRFLYVTGTRGDSAVVARARR